MQIEITRADDDYSRAGCSNLLNLTFKTAEDAAQFAGQFGGIADGLSVAKACGNTIKFGGGAYHTVCPSCGSVWSKLGDDAAVLEAA